MCANDIYARAARYGWQFEMLSGGIESIGQCLLTSPLGETHRCYTVTSAHDVLTTAVFDAWVRYEACCALLRIAQDPSHPQHPAATDWLANPSSKIDPWTAVQAAGHVTLAAPEDLPPTGYEVLDVDGDKGFDLREAMRRCQAMESATQLTETLADAAATPARSRL